MNTPLWKRGVRGDFNNTVHIRSFKNPMLGRMVEHNTSTETATPALKLTTT